MALKSYSSVTKGARITNCFTMCFLLDTGRKMNVDKQSEDTLDVTKQKETKLTFLQRETKYESAKC